MQPTDYLYCDQQRMNLFWRFIYSRHEVWHRRFILAEPPPWTNDTVIREYKFTNVYRELDRGTIFYLDEVATENMAPKDIIFRTMVYRTFNKIETWSELSASHLVTVDTWNHDEVELIIRRIGRAGPVFTNAHIVSPYTSMPGDSKAEKVVYLLSNLCKHIEEITTRIQECKSLKDVFAYVCSLYGFGPFLAYEIVVDLMYRKVIPFSEDDWANAGPGAMRGSALIYPNRKDYLAVMEELRDNQWSHFDRLYLPFAEIAYRGRTVSGIQGHLTLRNIEHCLCEFQKYERAFYGRGRPRNHFRPESQDNPFWMKRLRG